MGGTRRRFSSGQSTVEFGISSIVLLLILMGLLDLARGFYFAVRLQDAARAGARYGATYNRQSGTYPHLTTSAIEGAVDNVLTGAGMSSSTYEGTCPSTTNGNSQYNPPYADTAYPSAAATPYLYICYSFTSGASAPSNPQLTDLLVAVLYRYGSLTGFLQNQLSIASVKMVGTYHALIP